MAHYEWQMRLLIWSLILGLQWSSPFVCAAAIDRTKRPSDPSQILSQVKSMTDRQTYHIMKTNDRATDVILQSPELRQRILDILSSGFADPEWKDQVLESPFFMDWNSRRATLGHVAGWDDLLEMMEGLEYRKGDLLILRDDAITLIELVAEHMSSGPKIEDREVLSRALKSMDRLAQRFHFKIDLTPLTASLRDSHFSSSPKSTVATTGFRWPSPKSILSEQASRIHIHAKQSRSPENEAATR